MIRTIITPDKQTISIELPKSYVGKEIEVIAFAKDEEVNQKSSLQKITSFNAVAIDTLGYKFNRNEANER